MKLSYGGYEAFRKMVHNRLFYFVFLKLLAVFGFAKILDSVIDLNIDSFNKGRIEVDGGQTVKGN